MTEMHLMAPTAGRNAMQSRQVLRNTLAGTGTKLGLAWIALLGLVAVFAPFLANTKPILVSVAGHISSPVLKSLEPGDVVLLAVFAATVAVIAAKLTWQWKLWSLVATIIVIAPLSYWLVNPPQLSVYEQYRQQQKEGLYDWTLSAPVPYSPKDYLRDYQDPGLKAPQSSEAGRHWFGTESNGADVLSRMIYASRIALGIGFVATGIAIAIGIVLGGLMGYFSGIADMVGMRLVEIFEAVPTLFLLLTFVAFFGRSLYLMMVIIGITNWTGYARYVRAEFLKLRQQDFVQAAIACGLPLRSVLFRHMLPNALGPVLVSTSFGIASAILTESVLSFLGLGLVDDPSWGQMLNQAVQSANFYWWMAIFPGGAIFLTVLAYNLIGEALRDAVDPHLRKTAP